MATQQPLRSRTARASLALLGALLANGALGCGAKTALRRPDVEPGDASLDEGFDAAPDALDVVDARDAFEVGPDAPVLRPRRCDPVTLRTRVGSVVTLRPATDLVAPDGYRWTLTMQPAGSSARLFSEATDVAVLTPDRAGVYEAEAQIASPEAPGGSLRCLVTVRADPPDPRCPEYAIAEPRLERLAGGTAQVAVDRSWGAPRTLEPRDGEPGGLALDDSSARVAALVLERRARTSGLGDAERWETAVQEATGGMPVLVGRAGRTPQGLPLRRTTFRVESGTVSTPGAVRDAALRALYGADAPTPGPGYAAAAGFYIELTTVGVGANSLLLLAVSAAADFDDPRQPAALRVNDLANGTPVARPGSALEVDCHQVTASRDVSADFLWLVDTSGSMNDDQQRVGRTATAFVDALRRGGIGYRLGVLQAGGSRIDLSRGGGPSRTEPFRWIGDADDTTLRLAREVTEQPYDTGDTLRPFRVSGGAEEPLAAAVLALDEFERRASIGERNLEFLLRPEAARVAFLVTDEPGTNDYNRYFGLNPERIARWGSSTAPATVVANITRYFTDRRVVPFGLVPMRNAGRCPSIDALPACVILAAGGAAIPIEVADTAEADRAFASAMSRVTDVVSGAASEFVLPRVPLSASLRARVTSRLVPRSRADGFDYEDRANALVFRGPSYRPRRGDAVRAAYFYWRE